MPTGRLQLLLQVAMARLLLLRLRPLRHLLLPQLLPLHRKLPLHQPLRLLQPPR